MRKYGTHKPGPKRIYDYSMQDAAEFLKKNSAIVILVPSIDDYLIDMANKAGRDKKATPPAFYKFIDSVDEVVACAGLDVIGKKGIAGIKEGEVPDFVIEKIVRAVGREGLRAYLDKTSKDEE